MLRTTVAVALVLAGVGAAPAHADEVVVSTRADAPYEAGFGPGLWYIGQTFRAPDAEHLRLDWFSLALGNRGEPLPFAAKIFPWDPSAFRFTGPALWTHTGNLPTRPIEYRPFEVGGVPLQPGQQYIFLYEIDLHQMDRFDYNRLTIYDSNSSRRFGDPPRGDVYTGGRAQVGSRDRGISWGNDPRDVAIDFGFEAGFGSTVTPEPASMLLLGTGIAGLAGAARRRRREERDGSD